jgi:porin
MLVALFLFPIPRLDIGVRFVTVGRIMKYYFRFRLSWNVLLALGIMAPRLWAADDASTASAASAAPAPSTTPAAANSAVAAAASAPATGFWDRDNLLPDWDSWQSNLNDAGWKPFAIWTGEIWDNANGGIRDGIAQTSQLSFGGEADLEKLAGWKGATIRLSFNWIEGNNPNHNTGALASPTYYNPSNQMRLYNFYLKQKLLDDQLTVKIGQMGIDDDFSEPASLGIFLNAGISAAPTIYDQALANGDTTFPQYSVDGPGVFTRYDSKDLPVYGQLGVYMSDPGPDVSNNHGFDWRDGGGAAVLAETGWNYQIMHLPGTIAVGGFYNHGQFTNWDTNAVERGIYGTYGFVTQTLWQKMGADGTTPDSSLVGFAYGGVSGPSTRVGPASDFAMGLNWAGPLPGRPQDTAGLAMLYTRFSPNYTRSAFNPNGPGVTTAAETAMEFTYQIVVTPWFSVQPDAQVIFNPANAGTRATAIVIGLHVAVTF